MISFSLVRVAGDLIDKFIYYINQYNTMKSQALHYPRLDTVLMVEDLLKKKGEFRSKRSLWLALPKKTMYQTFSLILDYLEDSGKIILKDGKVVWIWNPAVAAKYMKSNLMVR